MMWENENNKLTRHISFFIVACSAEVVLAISVLFVPSGWKLVSFFLLL